LLRFLLSLVASHRAVAAKQVENSRYGVTLAQLRQKWRYMRVTSVSLVTASGLFP
jgi:hypothetical protein